MPSKFIIQLNLAALLMSSALSAQVPYGNNFAAGHYLQTRGINLYYEVYGSGDPILFLHGNGGSIDNFANQIPFFAGSYQVIAVDSRAQGKSVDTGDSLSFEEMTDDFNALLDSLHLDSCYVVGWSDGGIDGLLLAIRHPDKVRKLAITGANLRPDATALGPDIVRDIAAYVKELKAKPQTPEVKAQLKLAELDQNQPNIALEQINQIQCPTLVIGGDHDLIPVLHTVQIAQNIPRSYLWIIPNSGHGTPIYKKDVFNQTVLDFFIHPYQKNFQ
jgi:pimeloyl-ACP methyl ester carboxylesterase